MSYYCEVCRRSYIDVDACGSFAEVETGGIGACMRCNHGRECHAAPPA